MHFNDFIKINSGSCIATFRVLDIGPLDYGLISPDTHISLAPSAVTADCETNNVLDFAREIQKKVDYMNTWDYGSSLAELSDDVQKLVGLLEVPPPLYDLVCHEGCDGRE